MTRLDDTELVRLEYADESRLSRRFRAFREFHDPPLDERMVELVRQAMPARVLEVGCGAGELASLLQQRLAAEVIAVDLSPRMVALARARGLDARQGDVQQLPFDDASFDVVVADFMLYHAPDLMRALHDIARVLRPGGRLVASTLGPGTLSEMWDLIDADTSMHVAFSTETAAGLLGLVFDRVEHHDLDGEVRFPGYEAVIEHVSATITRSHLAPLVRPFEGPLLTRSRAAAFVAHTS